jgi:hypothetical protein
MCTYSYAYHVAHPHDANLMRSSAEEPAIEGTGVLPEDMLIDVGFAKDVGVRADNCTGFIIRNLWERDANEHGIYVLYSDGYIFDRTRGSYNKEYALFSYAADNGLYTDCEAEGGGDSGLYIGAAPDTHTLNRFSTEMRRCKLHHNALGFSGTQGNSVWMHDNDFYDNAIGISYDTENDHQNFPQRWSVIENNLIHDNNYDVYDDVRCTGVGPELTSSATDWLFGMWSSAASGLRIVWNNIRFGFILAGNPLEMPLPAQVHRNSFKGNKIGIDPLGMPAPNHTAFPPGGNYAPGGSDFFWDESGNDNCWGPHDPASGPIKTDPPNAGHPGPIPGPCPAPNVGSVGPSPLKTFVLLNCTLDGSNPPKTQDITYPCPWGQTNDAPANGDGRVRQRMVSGEDCDQLFALRRVPRPRPAIHSATVRGRSPAPPRPGRAPGTRAAARRRLSGVRAGTVSLRNALTPPGDDQPSSSPVAFRAATDGRRRAELRVRDDDGQSAGDPGRQFGLDREGSKGRLQRPSRLNGITSVIPRHADVLVGFLARAHQEQRRGRGRHPQDEPCCASGTTAGATRRPARGMVRA